MNQTFCKRVTIPLLICLASSVLCVAGADQVANLGDTQSFNQASTDQLQVNDNQSGGEGSTPLPGGEGSTEDSGGGGSSSGLVIAGVVVVGGLLLWWWLARDKTEKTVIDMEASNHLIERRLNKSTFLTFDAGPTPRMFMGHRGDQDELKMADLACGEVGLRVVF